MTLVRRLIIVATVAVALATPIGLGFPLSTLTTLGYSEPSAAAQERGRPEQRLPEDKKARTAQEGRR